MNCLSITLFFNIVPAFSKHLLSLGISFFNPESQKSAACPLNHVMTPSCTTSSSPSKFLRRIHGTTSSHFADSLRCHKQQQFVSKFPLYVHILLRNRMKERTSHLAGLWIGAAISNTSHSNKAGSTTVKRARLTGKGSRQTAMLP